MPNDFRPIAEKMRAEGLPDLAIRTFSHHYTTLCGEYSGLVGRDRIDPVDHLPDLESLGDVTDAGGRALAQAVVIKLNGGLGTSMGLARAKSLLPVKDGLTFLDIIARQILRLRSEFAAPLPVMFMNSFMTETDTLRHLEGYPELTEGQGEIPFSFLQHKVPKLDAETLQPAVWEADPAKEWCPPGHGDIYTALLAGGWIDRLIGQGVRYAFVSNSDNLGAVMNLQLLGHFASSDAPFMVEVTDRTPMDIKGGHLAAFKTGGFLIRESAQCPPEEEDEFQDIETYRHFNTNNLWLNLPAIKAKMEAGEGILDLPPIVNRKTVDPSDADSTPVIQLETAMSAALTVFEDASAIRVPRSRFVPVKTTQELLAIWSDLFLLDEHWNLFANPARALPPVTIELDPGPYKLVGDFEQRFAHGAPSLLACESLKIAGDHVFESEVTAKGQVDLENPGRDPVTIVAGTVLEGNGH